MNENYPIIVKTYNLTRWYIEKLSRLPKHHRFTLGEKIQNTLLDLLMLLSDAIYSKDKRVLLGGWMRNRRCDRVTRQISVLFKWEFIIYKYAIFGFDV